VLVKHTYPWPHYTVDNFLPKETFDLLVELRDHPSFNFVDCNENGRVIVKPTKNLPSKKNLLISLSNPEISKTIEQSVKDHLQGILPDKYCCIPDLIRCDPNYYYHPHVDHKDKLFSIVIFLYPPKSDATILMDKGVDYKVEWKPNRALIIKNEPHTMHYYHNKTIYPRLTMNVYITSKPGGFNVALNPRV